MTDLLDERLPARPIHTVGDAAYASGASRGLPAHVTLTSRLRSNAALYERKPPRTGKRGRPAKWGRRLPSLAQIATDSATEWTEASVTRYAKTKALMLTTIDCLCGPLGAETSVRVILVQDTAKSCGYQIALISTDLNASAGQIVCRYADRWPIEVAFEDAKHIFGVGDARNRARKAVERTVPFQFLCMTLMIVWYALSGHHPDVVSEHRARAPWYRSKANPSTADMLAKLRGASSSPLNITQERPAPLHRPKSRGSSTHGRPPGSEPPKSSCKHSSQQEAARLKCVLADRLECAIGWLMVRPD